MAFMTLFLSLQNRKRNNKAPNGSALWPGSNYGKPLAIENGLQPAVAQADDYPAVGVASFRGAIIGDGPALAMPFQTDGVFRL